MAEDQSRTRLVAEVERMDTHARLAYLKKQWGTNDLRVRGKPLKLRPDFPEQFGSIEDARSHCRGFFPWYNTEHRHAGIAFLMPEDVHYGRTTQVLQTRQRVLDAAFAANPNRFKGRAPHPQQPPEAVWINPPTTPETEYVEPDEQH